MAQIIEEVKVWNTPVIGAYLLWRFTEGYISSHPEGEAPIGLLHFLASGILSSEGLIKDISDRRPNLQSYIRGFEDNKNVDILVNIQQRIRSKMLYTLESLEIGIAHGLLVWDGISGRIYSKSLIKYPSQGHNLKELYLRNGLKAEILGKWFSEHDLASISSYLKVVL